MTRGKLGENMRKRVKKTKKRQKISEKCLKFSEISEQGGPKFGL